MHRKSKRRKTQHKKHRRYTKKWRGGTPPEEPAATTKKNIPRDVNIYATRIYHNPRESAPMAFFTNFYPKKELLKTMLEKYEIPENTKVRVNKITNFNQIDHMFVLRNANDIFSSTLKPMMLVAPENETPIQEIKTNKK